MKNFRLKWVGFFLIIIITVAGITAYQVNASSNQVPNTAKTSEYLVIGWNNLGMHCYNPDFSSLAILPPYNTLRAQVIKIGKVPQIVSGDPKISVEYSFPDNTYSVQGEGIAPGRR